MANEATQLAAPTKTPKAWAKEINTAHGKGIQACMDMARLLAAARDDLGDSVNWEEFVKDELNINPSDARKLDAIARNAWLIKRSNLNALPSAVSTLYELSRATDAKLETAKTKNKLHPKITAEEARKIAGHKPIPRGPQSSRRATRTIDESGKDVDDNGKSDAAQPVGSKVLEYPRGDERNVGTPSGNDRPRATRAQSRAEKDMEGTDACVRFLKAIRNPQERMLAVNSIIEQAGFKIVDGKLEVR